ncbi:RNA 3'-terminal phosphate cyclase [Nanoarchaeota archaeon]
MTDLIKLEGNYLEGGGQIIRTALALSTITGKGFEVDNIRAGRKKPGLKYQHMHSIKGLEKLCNAVTEGVELGSSYIKYLPGKIKGQTISIDIQTAGSITLMMQALLIPSLFADAKVRLQIKGGTDTKMSMPIDYFNHILVPHVRRFANINLSVLNRGYFPKGNGEVKIEIKPNYKLKDFESYELFLESLRENIPSFDLIDQGQLMQIRGISNAAKELEGKNVAERTANAARNALSKLDDGVKIDTEYRDTLSMGSAIVLWAIYSKKSDDVDVNDPIIIGSDALGERGKASEIVGEEAADRLIKEVGYGAPVDEYLADNLIPYLGLIGGKIKVAKISDHTRTNIYVVEQFLDVKFNIDEDNKIISVDL